MSCPHSFNRGNTNESIQEVITHDLALPISLSLDTEVSLSSASRTSATRGRELYKSVLGAKRLYGNRAQHSDRSRSSVGDDSAEDIGFGLCWNDQGRVRRSGFSTGSKSLG